MESQNCTRIAAATTFVPCVSQEPSAAVFEDAQAYAAQLRACQDALETLQDLSSNLHSQTEMGALVDGTLGSLLQTTGCVSASLWARRDLDACQPVVLMGCRVQDGGTDRADLESLAGLRLAGDPLPCYEQIEVQGQAVVDSCPDRQAQIGRWFTVSDLARASALYRDSHAWMAVPLRMQNRVLGVLRLDHARPDFFDESRKRLLNAAGGQIGLAMHNLHLQELQRKLDLAPGRNRATHDLHDAVSQTLFAANLVASTVSRDERLSDAARRELDALQRMSCSALAEMRMLLFELRPHALESARLPDLLRHAVQSLQGRGDVDVVADIAAEPAPPPKLRVEIYRIAQEALANIGRHSGARHVHVGWTILNGSRGRLHILDDGCGFDTAAGTAGHLGLDKMQERARSLDAHLTIKSAPGEGTELLLETNWS